MSTDNKTMFVKPINGALVRDPERAYQVLPEAGSTVPRNNYWLRRLADDSVVKAKAPNAKKTSTTQVEDK